MQPKYDVEVQLSGRNGNVFNLAAIVTNALRDNGATRQEIEQFRTEVRSGTYDEALRTMMKWVRVV